MSAERNIIDWSSPDVLLQIVDNIQSPLASIIEANKLKALKEGTSKSVNTSDIIFLCTSEINALIEELLEAIKSKSLNVSYKSQPEIFKIYNSNKNVQSMCHGKVIPNKISKPDQDWLLKMEKEIFKKVNHNDMNLYDLSYKMAVSERQLHRKIKTLLHLTPNKYIRILKLHRAKQYIDDYLYDSVSQIAYAVGYYDTYYFSKLFLKQYDVTPKELLLSLKE